MYYRANKSVAGSLAFAMLLAGPMCHGEFALNFAGAPGGTTIAHGGGTSGGQTPYYAGSGVDPISGLSYAHQIIGDPATGFAQEMWIRRGGSCYGGQGVCTASGGLEGKFTGNVLVGGNAGGGAGTGNPNQVLVRQVIGGTWDAGTSTWTCDTSYCDEFIKSSYADKPKITQGISATALTAKFIFDMSGIDYNTDSTVVTAVDGNAATTGASLINTQTVVDLATGKTVASYDIYDDAQDSYIDGGRYTYTNGTARLASNGTYTYVSGFYDQNQDYSPFLDHGVSNPWSYPASKP